MKQKEKEFRGLIHRQKDLIWHVCQDFGLSPAWTTDDAFQEVLLQIWSSMGQYKKKSSERTWCYRIAVNTMLSIKRKKSNQQLFENQKVNDNPPMSTFHSDLEEMIEQLGEPDSTIIRSSLAGFDYSEISEITELTVGAVAMRLSRAKDKLKKMINDEQ